AKYRGERKAGETPEFKDWREWEGEVGSGHFYTEDLEQVRRELLAEGHCPKVVMRSMSEWRCLRLRVRGGEDCVICAFHEDLEVLQAWMGRLGLPYRGQRLAGAAQNLQALCLECHRNKTALEFSHATTLESRFSRRAYEAYVESPRLPPLVFKLNSHKPERICYGIDVVRCRKNALAHSKFPAPIFCPKDNMEQALQQMEAAWPEGEEHYAKLSVNALIGLWARNMDLIYTMRTSNHQFDGSGCQHRELFLDAAGGMHWDHIYVTQLLSNRSCRPVHDFVMASEYIVTALREEGYKVKIITKTHSSVQNFGMQAETADHWARSTVRNGYCNIDWLPDVSLVISHAHRIRINARDNRRLAPPEAVTIEYSGTGPTTTNMPQTMRVWPGLKLIGAGGRVTKGIYVHVAEVGPEKIVLDGGDSFTHAALLKHTRLCHAITYASCQGLTLEGRVFLCDTESPHFTLRHLYVGTSRATSSELLSVL
ncbi:unnamed protein product, partial [Symbiodinium microadriaticum]